MASEGEDMTEERMESEREIGNEDTRGFETKKKIRKKSCSSSHRMRKEGMCVVGVIAVTQTDGWKVFCQRRRRDGCTYSGCSSKRARFSPFTKDFRGEGHQCSYDDPGADWDLVCRTPSESYREGSGLETCGLGLPLRRGLYLLGLLFITHKSFAFY